MAKPPDSDTYYQQLKSFIIETTGMVFYADKDDDLIRIINIRKKATGSESFAAYLDLLKDKMKGRRELDELVSELTIGETYFFRHAEQIDAVRNVILPHLIKRNRDVRRLRIWSAGCSTGAEPYTLAIILNNEFGGQLAGWTIDIIGSDINKKFLAHANRGRFNEWALRATPDDIKKSCFKRTGKEWIINPAFKKNVAFQYHNLVEDPFPSHLDNLFAFDLILCRNVTIYFERKIIQRMIGQFHESLADDGWLMVGHSEPDMELFKEFRSVNAPGTVLYQKSGEADEVGFQATPPPPAWTPPEPEPEPIIPVPTAKPSSPPTKPEKTSLDEIKSLADQGKVEEAAALCEKLLETDKLNPSVHLFNALVLGQMGKNEEAEKALRGAIYLDRSFALPHYHFGLFLQKKGDRKGAVKSLETAVKLLSKMDGAHTFEDGDGISVVQLKDLANIHLEVFRGE